MVTWDSLSAISSVTDYRISYNGMENFAPDGSKIVDRSSTTAIIEGLEEFTSYDITVQAVYSGRTGPLSIAVRVITFSYSKQINILYVYDCSKYSPLATVEVYLY